MNQYTYAHFPTFFSFRPQKDTQSCSQRLFTVKLWQLAHMWTFSNLAGWVEHRISGHQSLRAKSSNVKLLLYRNSSAQQCKIYETIIKTIGGLLKCHFLFINKRNTCLVDRVTQTLWTLGMSKKKEKLIHILNWLKKHFISHAAVWITMVF